jgi:hypothetical protein
VTPTIGDGITSRSHRKPLYFVLVHDLRRDQPFAIIPFFFDPLVICQLVFGYVRRDLEYRFGAVSGVVKIERSISKPDASPRLKGIAQGLG